MRIHNGSEQVICVGDTLRGEPKHKAMILEPGQAIDISDLLERVVVEFATTPGGLRMAIHEEALLYRANGATFH